mgnify:CR=1 FL=1
MHHIKTQNQTKSVNNSHILYSQIGEGKFGKVFISCLAEDLGHLTPDRLRACKVISIADVNDVKEIQQEIEIMKKNDHPNLVKMVDLCISPSNYYIFMEYCSEGDLKSFLEKFR